MKTLLSSISCLLIMLVLNNVKCDLPVHCLASAVEGTWMIHMTNNNGDSTLKCGHEHPDKNLDHLNTEFNSFNERYQTIIKLDRPNFIYSLKNESKVGTWTMVYDEGFELVMSDNIFFTFNRYEQSTKFKASNSDTEDTPGYKSLCDKTFVGWFKNKNNKNWGCFWAEKVNPDKYDLSELNYDDLFVNKSIRLKNNESKKKVDTKSESKKVKEQEHQIKIEKKEVEKQIDKHTTKTDDSSNSYVDFLKNLISSNPETSDEISNSGVPHLDIYFLNNLENEDTDKSKKYSNFLEETVTLQLSDRKSKMNSKKHNFTEKTFTPDNDYVNKINDPNNNYKWQATVYPEFIGKSYSSMRSLLGNVNSIKTKIKEKEIEKKDQFIELEVNIKSGSYNTESLPSSFTWTNVDGTNFDSPIKKQGECGSCYALAMVSTFEARLRIKSNNRVKPVLSSASVIGCSRTNQGCSGGYPFLVGKHAMDFGFVEESCQPYSEDDKTCKTLCYEDKVYKAKAYGFVGGYYGACSEEKMMEEIYKNGPIVVAINATPELYYYKSGIFHSDAVKKEGNGEKSVKPWEYTNHAVVAVGWGEEYVKDKLEKYWILKNSWGDTWGEKGYFKLSKGLDMASVEAQGEYVIPEDL